MKKTFFLLFWDHDFAEHKKTFSHVVLDSQLIPRGTLELQSCSCLSIFVEIAPVVTEIRPVIFQLLQSDPQATEK